MLSPSANTACSAPGAVTGRIVAEAVRRHEERAGAPIDEAHAWRQGHQASGGLGPRIVARAVATRLGAQVAQSLERLRGLAAGATLVAAVLALISGMVAAGVVFGAAATEARGQLNIFWVLSSLLGLQTLLLLVWAVFMGLPRSRGGVLGQALIGATASLARRANRDGVHALTVVALLGWLERTGSARWAAGMLTHLLWVAFGVGALLMSVLALTFRQYDFVWGTTLLGEESFVALVAGMGALPSAIGLEVPDAALVSASRIGIESMPAGRRAWSTLLLASLLVYGIVPRLGLALVCRWRLSRGLRTTGLDLQAPGYQRLAPRLMPVSASLGVVDSAPAGVKAVGTRGRRPVTGQGPVLLVWLALEDDCREPLEGLADARVQVWGSVDDRRAQARLLTELPALAPPPAVVVVVSSLLRTPDRHATTLLAQVHSATPAPVWLVLTGADRSGGLGIDPAGRAAAWEAVAARAGIDAMVVETAEAAARGRLETVFARLADEESAGGA
ncbi:MAG: DUF2868 domain-containing protein [Gammaproteobacteria bacterium]|nr:DUF2868 domain-containing protein [Gammaproteobacteria bacterium]